MSLMTYNPENNPFGHQRLQFSSKRKPGTINTDNHIGVMNDQSHGYSED